MSNSHRLGKSMAVVLGLVFAVTTGCASTGQDRSAAAVSGLKDTREKLAAAPAHIDATLASLNAMQGAADLPGAFSKYSDNVDQTQSNAQDVKSQVADMHDRGQEYIQKWQEEMSTVTDPNLKAAADARRQAVQSRYTDIQNAYDNAKNAYQVYYTDLTGIRTYLSNDLSPAGVTAAKSIIDKANADGATLKDKTNAVVAVLDQVSTALPGGAAAAK